MEAMKKRALLCPKHAAAKFLQRRLALSGISPQVGKHAGLRAATVKTAGVKLSKSCSDGILIPYFHPDGRPMKGMFRWRNNPDARIGFAATTKQIRYYQPTGKGCVVYFPKVQGLEWEKILADPEQAVVIVEGELKALSLCARGVPALGIGGVANWVTAGRELLSALRQLAEDGREILVPFDSDAADNPQVAGMHYALGRALLDAGAKPVLIVLPKNANDPTAKVGADDYLQTVPDLREGQLLQNLRSLEDESAPFALAAEMYRLNAEYVYVESLSRVIRLRDRCAWNVQQFAYIERGQVADKNAKGEKISRPLANAWLRWKHRNTVSKIDYIPVAQGEEPTYVRDDKGERVLNTFLGWATEPKEDSAAVAQNWTWLLDHVFQVDRQDVEQAHRIMCRRWFEMWWAYPVQHPGSKLHSACILQGMQGSGKGFLGHLVELSVYGNHFCEITQENLESDFNASYVKGKSLVMGSEITGKNREKRRVAEFLKHIITSEKLIVNEKQIPQYPLMTE